MLFFSGVGGAAHDLPAVGECAPLRSCYPVVDGEITGGYGVGLVGGGTPWGAGAYVPPLSPVVGEDVESLAFVLVVAGEARASVEGAAVGAVTESPSSHDRVCRRG